MTASFSIIIPAHNEADYIATCLEALLASVRVEGAKEVIVAANGCTDDTVSIADEFASGFAAKGWGFQVLDLAQGGKMGALNAGDQAAKHGGRIYLDADVVVTPDLISAMTQAMAVDTPKYVSGSPVVTTKGNPISRLYARFWSTHHFVTDGAPGFGIFAVNAAARQRWGAFPDLISDDTFVRLNFTPAERGRVLATYDWPIIEGFAALVKVRRRQDIGVAEVEQLFPHLLVNNDPVPDHAPGFLRRALKDPLGCLAYVIVAASTRLPDRNAHRWARGR